MINQFEAVADCARLEGELLTSMGWLTLPEEIRELSHDIRKSLRRIVGDTVGNVKLRNIEVFTEIGPKSDRFKKYVEALFGRYIPGNVDSDQMRLAVRYAISLAISICSVEYHMTAALNSTASASLDDDGEEDELFGDDDFSDDGVFDENFGVAPNTDEKPN